MSSDEQQSDVDSESNDVETTGLIATRAKRSTAGNLYASLRANLDDEELQKELLAEDEEDDAVDYEGSGKDEDDDEALESSGDEDDAGPPQEGQAEDLAGEKELKKIERKEQRQKRKARDAKLKLPAWQQKKRVKLADDVKTEDGAAVDRPKKKSERSNWLPTADDAPIRQSRRALAVANREVTHANLKQSAERSEKQRRVMKDAAEREKLKKRADLTQEERLEMCKRIERQTAKDFGRWEREEAERQRVRDEILAAKRQRGLEGPFIRMWSGSAVWAGPNMVDKRCEHGSKDVNVKEEQSEPSLDVTDPDNGNTLNVVTNIVTEGGDVTASKAPTPPSTGETDHSKPASLQPPPSTKLDTHMPDALDSTTTSTPTNTSAVPINPPPTESAPTPWLSGIHDYAMQDAPVLPAPTSSTPLPPQAVAPAPIQNVPSVSAPPYSQTATASPSPMAQGPEQHLQLSNAQPIFTHQLQPQPPHISWPPGSATLLPSSVQSTVANSVVSTPPAPPVPVLREQAQRSLVILEQFEDLETSTTKRSSKAAGSGIESTALTSILLPESYPALTSEESKYLLAKHKTKLREKILPPAPPKQLCAIMSSVAKYRDPKTGLCYADVHIYKIIQRILAGGYQWSALLGCWVGPAYGPMGRPARGVPEGFAGPPVVVASEKEGVVKSETVA